MRRPKSRKFKLQIRQSESAEIDTLESWIESGKPESGSNPLSLSLPQENSRIGKLQDGSFSPYAGADKFIQLPLSKKTKDGLRVAKYSKMTEIQKASLPHSLCGRDILGAAKTGSGKTLAFVIPVLEKLYRARWEPEAGVGCIIISPTRELASQLFEELKLVGRYHGFSAGLLIGGRKDVDTEKERVNELNILVCTPGRLLQHMDETPNFECTQLQILVLDEADRILDSGFKKELNAIISQLPKHRQTLLFSATQTKSIQDLARLSLKDPEYLSVHEESTTATPSLLEQKAIVIPLDRKLDVLWSFIKANLRSRILVFLTTCKQVRFICAAFSKLRPGIPLNCLYSRMSQDKRMHIYAKFCERKSVLFSTDVSARGLDFNKGVDWVVQVDCPDDVATYIHRVGRTARYNSKGRSVLFLTPSETKMLDKLQEKKIPIKYIKDFLSKANNKKVHPVSGLLAALLVKHPDLKYLAERAITTYLKSIPKKHDKEVFDVNKLPIDEFSASFGLPMTPYIGFGPKQGKGKKISQMTIAQDDNNNNITSFGRPSEPLNASSEPDVRNLEKADLLAEEALLQEKDTEHADQENAVNILDATPATRVLKKKKLKINMHRPLGTRIVFDEEGESLPPLAKLAMPIDESGKLDVVKVSQRYAELREEMKIVDKEDKALDRQRRKERRTKEKMKKLNRSRDAEEEEDGDITGEYEEDITNTKRVGKKAKISFDSDIDHKRKKDEKIIGLGSDAKAITLAEQEELALKLLSSMHS